MTWETGLEYIGDFVKDELRDGRFFWAHDGTGVITQAVDGQKRKTLLDKDEIQTGRF